MSPLLEEFPLPGIFTNICICICMILHSHWHLHLHLHLHLYLHFYKDFYSTSRRVTNTFQAVIVTDEVRSYAIFNYDWLGWTTHTEAGGDTSEGQVQCPTSTYILKILYPIPCIYTFTKSNHPMQCIPYINLQYSILN